MTRTTTEIRKTAAMTKPATAMVTEPVTTIARPALMAGKPAQTAGKPLHGSKSKPARMATSSRPAHGGKPAHKATSSGAAVTTTDHDAIRKWAEKRGGHPTSVTGTEHGKESAGVLRLDFGVKDEKLHSVNWDSFFDKFEEARLAFLYQDRTADGKMSRFHKFVHRH